MLITLNVLNRHTGTEELRLISDNFDLVKSIAKDFPAHTTFHVDGFILNKLQFSEKSVLHVLDLSEQAKLEHLQEWLNDLP